MPPFPSCAPAICRGREPSTIGSPAKSRRSAVRWHSARGSAEGPGRRNRGRCRLDDLDDFARIDLSNPTGDWVLESSATRVNVIVRDNDVAAVHQCAQTKLQADEPAGKVTFELTRSQNTSGTTTGWVGISNWPDSRVSLEVSFAPGETTRFADLQWENNSVYHGTREWNFTCGGSGPGASVSVARTLTITDDEPYRPWLPAVHRSAENDTPQLLAIPLTFVPRSAISWRQRRSRARNIHDDD